MYVYIHLPVPFCIRILFLQQFIIHGHVEYYLYTCACINSYHTIKLTAILKNIKIFIYMYMYRYSNSSKHCTVKQL